MGQKSRLKNQRRRTLGAIVGHTNNTPVAQNLIEFQVPQRLGRGMEPGTKGFMLGKCSIFLSNSVYGWHISIAHPSRYPTWDEIATARYQLIPNDVTMVMVLPPREEFINIHRNCFQLHQLADNWRTEKAPLTLSETTRAP